MKSQLAILIIILLIVYPQISSATDVSGDVWGEWTAVGNPYNVVGDLRVPPGSTLVIGPGCYIEFQGYYQFLVDSSAILQAIGTDADSIYFIAADTIAGWRGITFDHADSSIIINYCVFKYVRYNWGESAIKVVSCNLICHHNTFANNEVIVISCDGFSHIEIYDNIFVFNSIANVEDVIH